jgi:hypothetical protein
MDKQSAVEIVRYFAIGIALATGVFVLFRFVNARAEKVLRHWAMENDLELLHFERCFFTGGFNPLTTSRSQIVYFVRVKDQKHHERAGWVRCGGFWDFMFISDKAEVKWKTQ